MTQIKKKLKPREKRFCSAFVATGDAEKAARRAGYPAGFAQTGEELLCDDRILSEIERLTARRSRVLSGLAAQGYRRLAFGDVTDALRLIYLENPTAEQLREMDLGMISEIKSKDGALEMKFFDRLKALEHLADVREESGSVSGLFDAIGRGARHAGGETAD